MVAGADEARPLQDEEKDHDHDHDHDEEEGATSSSLSSFLRELAFAPYVAPPGEEHARIGETIDRFQITGLLGRGGMGVVYSALDLTLKRKIALKVLPAAAVESEDRRRRLLREARAGAAVSHPNIAAVFDVGEADGAVFIAMECVEGRSLRAVMEAAGAALPEAEAVHIGREIARGLAAAHVAGVTHRDIKPENVMIGDEGVVKLVDFGLAKPRGTSGEAGPFESTDIATREGRILGTPSYMSPEQARGLSADARSDVFAFGIVLFEMLAHVRPFCGATVTDVLAAILRDTPPLLPFLRDGARGPLARLVSRCLEKDPSKRYAHAGELLVALDTKAPTLTKTVRARRRATRRSRCQGTDFDEHTPRPLRRLWLASLVVLAPGLVARCSSIAPPNAVPPPQPPSMYVRAQSSRPGTHEPGPLREPTPYIVPFRVPVEAGVMALALSFSSLALTTRGDILMWGTPPGEEPRLVQALSDPRGDGDRHRRLSDDGRGSRRKSLGLAPPSPATGPPRSRFRSSIGRPRE